jgi:long-chain acyl-CoA synthetase
VGLKLAYKAGRSGRFRPAARQTWACRAFAAYTAGRGSQPDVIRFFHALGINLKQIYGSTEVTGGLTMHRDGDIKFASVGKPVPGTRCKLTHNTSEILLTGPVIFQGYYKNAEATTEKRCCR